MSFPRASRACDWPRDHAHQGTAAARKPAPASSQTRRTIEGFGISSTCFRISSSSSSASQAELVSRSSAPRSRMPAPHCQRERATRQQGVELVANIDLVSACPRGTSGTRICLNQQDWVIFKRMSGPYRLPRYFG